jgi:predicted transcriptional regulator
MTTDQEAEDMAAAVLHRMTQRGIVAREAERRAQQWEGQCRELRERVAGLEARVASAVAQGRIRELEAQVVSERARADKAERQLSRSLPDDYDSLDEYIKEINDENTLFTFQAAEARGVLRDILASEALCNCGPYFSEGEALEKRIRVVLDDPPGAEQRWKDRQARVSSAELEKVQAQEETQRGLEERATELATLSSLARAVCVSLARDDNNVTPDTVAALRAYLEKGAHDA